MKNAMNFSQTKKKFKATRVVVECSVGCTEVQRLRTGVGGGLFGRDSGGVLFSRESEILFSPRPSLFSPN